MVNINDISIEDILAVGKLMQFADDHGIPVDMSLDVFINWIPENQDLIAELSAQAETAGDDGKVIIAIMSALLLGWHLGAKSVREEA